MKTLRAVGVALALALGWADSVAAQGSVVIFGGKDTQGTAVTANPVVIGGIGSTALPAAVTPDGDAQRLWLSVNGAANVIIRDSVGDSSMDDANNALRVNCAVGCSGSSFADNAAFTFGTTPVS